MDIEFIKKIQDIFRTIFTEPDPDSITTPLFYREKYSAAGINSAHIDSLNESNWHKIPVISRQEIVSAPYKTRCTGEEEGMHKIISANEADRFFLIHRTIKEINTEDLPPNGERPMVILSDVYEAIERCLFFYGKNKLPLIGEFFNPAVVYATARQYDIDALFMDNAAIGAFRTELLKNIPGIKYATVLDTSFSQKSIAWPEKIELRLIISIPEVGAIAHACPESIRKEKLVFHPADHIYIEPSGLSLITSARLTACPMIRYQSALYFEETPAACGCGKKSYRT